jgi:drug/metabolite transporter (DMT)-like permease
VTGAAAAVVFALIAAACFGLALVVTQFGLRHLAPADGALVSIPVTAMLFWALSPFCLDPSGWQASAALLFAGVGLFFPAAVTQLTFEANRRLGPTTAAALGGTTPLFAGVAAVLFLGERPTPLAAAATLAVVAGIATLSGQHKGGLAAARTRLLLLPLAAALLRGLAQAATKIGLTLWPSAFGAALIGYSVSALALAVDARLRRGVVRPAFNRHGALWFALVGICNGAAVLAMYAALAFGAVTLVAPTIATYPLFSLIFGALLLRDERVTARAATGTLLVVAGIGALILARLD